ncbi:PREDICTED: kinetochore protein spc7-like [Branchiostoma belcheri]|uniref:Kinetochore protein spc7-like n=1 Tax=Branchiostoma belcheri TaxID=7741 RepID=A0A6P4ZZ62_BRABE|nr:PREDICTED: kinetochore protein spc7-like [Branchiostoma belcheri]
MQQKPAQTEDRPVSSGEHTVVFGPGDHDDMDFTVAFSSRRQTMGLEKEGETQRQVGVAALSVFNEEKTTVFSNMEPDADMDFTSTINSISSSQETAPVQPAQRTEEPDKTIIFSNTHTGADMDFTTTIKSMKMAQENVPQQPTSMAQKPIEDKTTIFGEVESGADMEFTTVISSDGAGEHVPDLTSSVQPQEPAQDKTVIFSNVESSAEMEFTTTISSSAEAQEQVPGSACRPVPQEATQDRTTVFTDAELGGDMEFTVAVDSLRPGTDSVSSHAPPILCEDTNVVGDMEFTACTLPQQGRLSVSQFLTYCNIVFQDQGKDRRSVMPLIKSDPPEILYEHLEILSILLPQAHMYEWSCNKLQEHISSTRQLVKQQEQRLDQENPALFLEAQKMIQDGKLKEVDDLKKDMESLRSCCKKQAKTEWHEWNCKMTGAVVESLKEEYADMKTGVEELDASLQKIDQSLATLDDVEKDLEDAIANLEGMTLPSDEDIQRYKEQQAVLLQKEEELASSRQEQEHLKSTLSSLQQERESLELQVDQLQLQGRELGLQQEGEDSTAVEKREEQVRALNRLQGLVEWDLEELTDSQLRVTFLQKSLLLTVAYAGVKDDRQKIADIRFESLLADEAAPWAHLCHHMVLGALDQPQLVHTYPTFPTQSKLLHRVSLLVSEARRLGDEVQDVILRHPFTTVDGTDLTVEFSNVEAHAKFFVTFSLTPGAYPNQVVKCTCTHRIGAISPSAVESALCAVPAGSLYLSRLVQCVEELIQQHASSLHQTNTTHRDL